MYNFFIDDLKKSLVKLVSKTNIKYENYKLKNNIKELYAIIGQKVYNHSKHKTLTELKLDNIFKQIKEIENKINNINMNKCLNCDYVTNKEEVFCPICGHKLNI